MTSTEWANIQEALVAVLGPVIGLAMAGMIATSIGLGILELIRDLSGWIIRLAGDQD